MSGALILIVDDDPAIATMLRVAIREEGFTPAVATTGAEALDMVAMLVPDLMILDLGLPDLDGMVVCRRLRDRADTTPILMLTARDGVQDRVSGLRSGADDYLVKPFALEELLARVEALLRRRPPDEDEGSIGEYRFGDLMLDAGARTVRRGDRLLDLTRTEFNLLEALIRHPGQVLTRVQLLEAVWGHDLEVESATLDTYISYIRRKLESDGERRIVQTARGVGFVLRAEP